jgi:hypothetical protein
MTWQVNQYAVLPVVITIFLQWDYTPCVLSDLLGYRSGGPGSIPSTTKKKSGGGLERGPLCLVSTTEELLDKKVVAPV